MRDLPKDSELALIQGVCFGSLFSWALPAHCSAYLADRPEGVFQRLGEQKGGEEIWLRLYESSVTKASTDSPFRQLIDYMSQRRLP